MTPEILKHAGLVLARYTVLYCDVWGVVHNGAQPHARACQALIQFRSQGGVVILVSNAPVPKANVQAMLDRVGVPDGIADDIVSSGDIALSHVREVGYHHAYFIGPQDRDAAFFTQCTAQRALLNKAEAIICTGLNDDRNETAEDYRDVLEQALDRSLPFVCANPDLVVDVGASRFYCAGAIGDLYEHLGGEVYWAGKPHASAYNAAAKAAKSLQNDNVDPTQALVIGDALRTDIEGARRAGLDALFITGGIHRDDVVADGDIVATKLEALFTGDAPPALAAMVELAW